MNSHHPSQGMLARAFRAPLLLLVLATLLLSTNACNRAHYRRQADVEAAGLIREKINDQRWALPRTTIDVDPRSRMYDPYNPDRPPMPPDDPASHTLMDCVDGKRNYPRWHQDGDIDDVENPSWRAYLPYDDQGVVKLDLPTAVMLALLHSPDYQEEFEDLYLSALDVSAERFQFDGQWFGGTDVFYRASGRNSGQPLSRLSVDSNLRRNKAFVSGATLVTNLANSIVWNLHGPDSNLTTSLLDLSFVQPLLRGAGRDRVLTRLTLAERQLLANVRQMERFRRGFYLELSTGDGGTFGARRIGGLFGGSGLEGFTGVGGGFGGVGSFVAGAGGADAAGDALQVGGFLGLLQNRQNIKNQESNIAGLRSNVMQFEQTLAENLQTIPDDPTELVRNRLQIAQARQTLYDQEFALVSAQAQYQARLDNYKVELGLPPTLCVEIDDPLLDQFNFLDPEMVPIQNELANLRQLVGAITNQILSSATSEEVDGAPVATIPWSQQLMDHLRRLSTYVARIKSLQQQISTVALATVQVDIDQLHDMLPRRRQTLSRLAAKYPKVLDREHLNAIACQTRLPVDIDPYVLDVSRLDSLSDDLIAEHDRLRTQLEGYGTVLDTMEADLHHLLQSGEHLDPAELHRFLEQRIVFEIPSLLSNLSSDVLDLSLVQARARADSIDLTPVDLSMRAAICIASVNRLDWMNARASLVDTWRAIHFVANDLEGVLDLVVDGNIGTVGDNPVDFRGTTGTLRMGLEFDAPLTRLLERNNYRQVLIDYQQARRSYYQFVDRVSQGLRSTIRTLDLNELNFETRRVAVLSAIQQVVLNDEIQTLNEERGLAQGVTAARDIVQALSDLQQAQDDFMGVWLTYEVNRRFLDFDLGTMELDPSGLWVDPGPVEEGESPYICEAGCVPLLSPHVAGWFQADEGEGTSPAQVGASTAIVRLEDLPEPPANAP